LRLAKGERQLASVSAPISDALQRFFGPNAVPTGFSIFGTAEEGLLARTYAEGSDQTSVQPTEARVFVTLRELRNTVQLA
jgi:hypothetical protein